MMASDLSGRQHRIFSRMFKRTQRREDIACSILALPAEIRQQIYEHYFSDSYVRYGRQRGQYSVKGKRNGPAYCLGPDQIALLKTNKFVYQEALPILLSNITLLLDRTDAFDSLRQIYDHTYILPRRTVPLHPNPIPSFLFRLITNARHMILSKIGELHPYLPMPDLPHLQTITIFGFYPRLHNHLSWTYAVAPSRRFWRLHWNPRWLRTFIQTSGDDVDFLEVTARLHTAFNTRTSRVQIKLKAWALEEVSMLWNKSGMRLMEVNTDLDDAERRWTWDILAYPEIDGWKCRSPISMQHPHLASIEWDTFRKESATRTQTAATLFRENGGEPVSGQGRKGVRWPWPERTLVNGGADGGEAARVSFPGVSSACTAGNLGLSIQDIGNNTLGLPSSPRQHHGASGPLAGVHPTSAEPDAQEWATITDGGDWQSEGSADVAFKEWDTALDLHETSG